MDILLSVIMAIFKVEKRPFTSFMIRGGIGFIGILIICGFSTGWYDFTDRFTYILFFVAAIFSFGISGISGILEVLDWYKCKGEEESLEKEENKKNK